MKQKPEILSQSPTDDPHGDHKWLQSKLKNVPYTRFGKLLMPMKDVVEMRNSLCQGCGETKRDVKIWYAQEFCGACVEAFQHGRSRK